MNLKSALAAGALLLAAACGGGSSDSGSGSMSNGSGSGSMSNGSGSSTCQPQPPVVGADLKVAKDGSVVGTLVSGPGSSSLVFIDLVWATGLPVDAANHQIDAAGLAQAGTAFGTTVQLRPTSSTLVNGQRVTTFPAGTPVVLRETLTHPAPQPDQTATTGNDLVTVLPGANPIASVTFGPNNTASVSFTSFGAGADYVVSLSNVTSISGGSGC